MEIIPRKEAKHLGLKRYYTGKLCKHNHFSERIVSNGRCVECANITFHQYYEDNKDQIKQYREAKKVAMQVWQKQYREDNKALCQSRQKQYYEDNKDQIKQYREDNKVAIQSRQKQYFKANKVAMQVWYKQYYEDNKPQILAQNKKWAKKNPERLSLYDDLRKKVFLQAIPSWFDNFEEFRVREVYLRRNELNTLWGTIFAVDHIVPLQSEFVCGLHCWANLQLLDKSTNSSKGNRTWVDMWEEIIQSKT